MKIETNPLKVRLQEAKDYLGKRWILHPEYVPTPRHSNDMNVYKPHRFLRGVEDEARKAGRL